jgi:hypothetical protein
MDDPAREYFGAAMNQIGKICIDDLRTFSHSWHHTAEEARGEDFHQGRTEGDLS